MTKDLDKQVAHMLYDPQKKREEAAMTKQKIIFEAAGALVEGDQYTGVTVDDLDDLVADLFSDDEEA
ncbi:MAG: hypothetical protein D6698_04085 [Gammaproteobacteria bacterium]|nr:MAG: hypothetical protein D6698_04085 [Gammaproteobacteria bacterium]